jgi:hypothetical protein
MKVIEGGFGKKGNLSAVEVFDSVRKTENLKEYKKPFVLPDLAKRWS